MIKVDPMTKLSRDFSLAEFLVTATGVENVPSSRAIRQLRYLVNSILQPLRDHLGMPIVVSSGYRNQAVNAQVGGVDNSQHLTGNACDISVEGYTPQMLIDVIQGIGLPYDQLIAEDRDGVKWLHLSYRPADRFNRYQVIA